MPQTTDNMDNKPVVFACYLHTLPSDCPHLLAQCTTPSGRQFYSGKTVHLQGEILWWFYLSLVNLAPLLCACWQSLLLRDCFEWKLTCHGVPTSLLSGGGSVFFLYFAALICAISYINLFSPFFIFTTCTHCTECSIAFGQLSEAAVLKKCFL